MGKSKWFLNLLLVIFILLLIYSIYNIFILTKDHHDNKKEVEELQEEIIIKKEETPSPTVEEEEEENYGLVLDFDKLYQINSDTVGWIEIRNTNINYPIVQTDNNGYYLNHSFYKTVNGDGWIFMNFTNADNFRDPNTIIFGHDTHGSYMFSDLKKLYDGLLGNYIPITIYTRDKNHYYETFSIFLVDETNNQFLNQVLTEEDLKDAISKSRYDFNLEVSTNDNILTLSTCYNSSKEKVVLLAKKIR